MSWLLIQIATQVFPFFEIPNWAVRLVVLLLIIGFPVALIFSWAYEITPEGIKLESEIDLTRSVPRKTGRKLIAFTSVVAAIAASLFILQFVRTRSTSSEPATTSAIPNKSIAVLPFDNLSRDPDNAYFCEGVQDEILDSFGQGRGLESDFAHIDAALQERAGQSTPNREATRRGPLMEGSVQRANDQIRVNVQLINALTDAHLWAETSIGN